jgi:hypothetical protein
MNHQLHHECCRVASAGLKHPTWVFLATIGRHGGSKALRVAATEAPPLPAMKSPFASQGQSLEQSSDVASSANATQGLVGLQRLEASCDCHSLARLHLPSRSNQPVKQALPCTMLQETYHRPIHPRGQQRRRCVASCHLEPRHVFWTDPEKCL